MPTGQRRALFNNDETDNLVKPRCVKPVLRDMAVWRDWGSFEVRVVAIIGARHPKQLTDTTPATDVELSDETLREIEMIMKDAVPTAGPSPVAM